MTVSLGIRAAVIGMAAIFGLTYSLTTAVIALDLAARGVGEAVIGLNAAMHAVGVLLAAPFLPWAVARFNARPLVLASLVITAVTLVALPLAPAIWMWFPLRIGLGIAAETLFVMSETWTTQFSSDADRGRSMAIYMTAMSLGFAAGPIIVSVVGSGGALPFGIGVFCVLLTAGLALLPGLPPVAIDKQHAGASAWRLAPIGLAAAALNAAIEAAGLSFLPLYAMQFGWGEQDATRLIGTLMVGAIALQLPIGWLADRMDKRRLLLALSLIAGLSALIWPAILAIPALSYAVLFLWGGVFVGIYTTMLALLGSRFTGGALVGVYAVMGLAWGVGALTGPLLVGVAAGVTLHGLPLMTALACLVFAAFVLARPRSA